MKKPILFSLLGLVFALAFIFVSSVSINASDFLLSRAGGGESFGDGGFDFGGSSDWGSDSWSDSSYSYNGTSGDSVGGSFCAFIVIIIIIIIIIMKSKKTGGGTSATTTVSSGGNATNKNQNASEIKENIAKLKEIDPKFDEQKFKTHIKKVFMAVQEGWTERDQAVCRPFMSEEVYQSHQMQIDNMKKSKIINVLENIVVGSTEFARIDLGDDFHKITMKVRAAMKDYKVNEDEPKKVIEGDKKQSPPFTEYWSFIRKSNLKTKVKDGIFDRKCPNCGAPIDVDVAGKCKYCNANVVNGDYDWVLSEIIQKSEWQE
jgi:hypothetical protein